MVQWVKNLTSVAWITLEVQFSSRPCAVVKDLTLPQLQHWLQLWLGFSPGLATSTCHGVAIYKREREREKERERVKEIKFMLVLQSAFIDHLALFFPLAS